MKTFSAEGVGSAGQCLVPQIACMVHEIIIG